MQPGDTLDGRYTIIERLGAGGMGEVYKATHTMLGATRVIKVVHPQISASDDARDRFMREARAATKIQHQNVATLHDFAALPDGSHYMVWEYIDGQNVAQRLRARGTLPPRQAIRIAVQALRGLEAIHRAGIVHRDISPENLMITRDDEVKIIDLGVAKLDDTEAVSQTRTGIFVGKLRYASPEQLGFLPEGEKIDGRTDLYAVAMVLVELLTGRPPYEAKSPHEYFVLHAREPKFTVELPRELPGGEALQRVLEKALARDRNERYSTARDFAAALEEIERTLPNANEMATIETPLEGDATMRVTPFAADTLHRDTVRTDAPAAPTIRTPLPAMAPPPPPPAYSAAVPPPPPAPPPSMKKGLNPAYLIGLIAVLALAIGAIAFWPREHERPPIIRLPETLPTTTTAPTATVPSTPPEASQTALTVTSPATTASSDTAATTPVVVADTVAPATATAPSTTGAPPVTTTTPPPVKPASSSPSPRKLAPAKPSPRPVPSQTVPPPEPEPVASHGSAPTYYDGGDNSDGNDDAVEQLRRQLQGTTKIALRAGGMQVELARELRAALPAVEFAPYADVVVRFDGTLERLGRGRKRRAATAEVLKNGRVIFRYEMPDEVYRVGSTPAEAFARILADAMSE